MKTIREIVDKLDLTLEEATELACLQACGQMVSEPNGDIMVYMGSKAFKKMNDYEEYLFVKYKGRDLYDTISKHWKDFYREKYEKQEVYLMNHRNDPIRCKGCGRYMERGLMYQVDHSCPSLSKFTNFKDTSITLKELFN